MKESDVKEKLSKLYALYHGAKTEGERRSAVKAKARILKSMESSTQYKFSLNNRKNAELFTSILEQYEIRDYRPYKNEHSTIIAKVPGYFVDNILWPEYQSSLNR